MYQYCSSLPFGDNLQCTTTQGGPVTTLDPSAMHFTGKERDIESGNDYFGNRYFGSGMGRWLSPDMAAFAFDIDNPQTQNKYRYGLNNPLRYIDPDGRYERDVHYGLTYSLAYAAGYSLSQSSRIASADQGIDDNPATEPFAGRAARRNFHFTSQARRAELWDFTGVEEGLGVYLHAEQDSYSHDGFGPTFGHLFAGHSPDKTYTDPDKADRMAVDTYGALIEAGDSIGTEAPAIPYSEIEPFVKAFNRATTDGDKQEQLDLFNKYVEGYRDRHKQRGGPITTNCPAESSSC